MAKPSEYSLPMWCPWCGALAEDSSGAGTRAIEPGTVEHMIGRRCLGCERRFCITWRECDDE